MGLQHVKATFEKYGREDPMYAVLTDHSRRGCRWDPEEFFARGRQEIDAVVRYLEAKALLPPLGHALDFGCGVGRLTQALAGRFAHVTGVDISSTMIESARAHDHHPGHVEYVMNDVPSLACFPDRSFDLVYSNITLQHVPPAPALAYVAEFVRVLRDDGLALFQMRIGRRIAPGTVGAWWYRIRREHIRRWWQTLRGRIPYEMHYVARSEVEETVAAAGGRIVDVTDLSRDRNGVSLRFAVRRAA
jgi:ubiquinone/menaquinone biosynthesis C-methylase UbiE